MIINCNQKVNGTNVGTGTTYSSLKALAYSIVARDDAGCASNLVYEILSDPPGNCLFFN